MPFTVNREFPGRTFNTYQEYLQARAEQKVQGIPPKVILAPPKKEEAPTKLVAQIVPIPKESLERRVAELERLVQELSAANSGEKTAQPIELGTVLYGESKGSSFSIEAIEEGFLCSDGTIYHTLSAAAFGVSGNRRSGWKFWKNKDGRPIGEATGRFERGYESTVSMPRM